MYKIHTKAVFSVMIALVLVFPQFLHAQCKIGKRSSDGKIYRTCGKQVRLIPFDYDKYDYYVEKWDSKSMSSLIRYTSVDPDRDTKNEDYLILDYKNLKLYDWICLNSTAFDLDKRGHWEKIDPDRTKARRFQLRTFNHCAIPVRTYAKLPDRWEDFNRFDTERTRLLKRKK